MTPKQQTFFRARLDSARGRVEETLDFLLPTGAGAQGVLADAMRHGTLNGGKRMRAFLTIEVADLFDTNPERADRVAASVECLHAYSLVHDDLPCMDDDDLRRGQPTVHKKWDEATAVLAGDGLQTLAFEILAAPETHEDGDVRAALLLSLAQNSGLSGMVGGQMLDIAAETTASHDQAEIEKIQMLKTGALIAHAAVSGAILAQAKPTDRRAIHDYACDLGSAYQIADDILDVTGDEAETGKAVGKDAGAGKATFVDLLGLEGATVRAKELVDRACERLSSFGPDADALRCAAQYTVSRRS